LCKIGIIKAYELRQKIVETDVHLKKISKNIKAEPTEGSSSPPAHRSNSFSSEAPGNLNYFNDVEYVDIKPDIDSVPSPPEPKRPDPKPKQREIGNFDGFPDLADMDDSELYKCFTCDRSFKSLELLKKHEANKQNDGLCERMPSKANTRQCYFCQKKFKSIVAKQNHLLKDHSNVSMQCTQCTYTTTSVKVLENHLWCHQYVSVESIPGLI
jgi:hypothetical protein